MPASTSPELPGVDALPPIPEALLALAPLHLVNRSKDRYLGDNICVNLPDLALRDQTLLTGLYKTFSELLYLITDGSKDDDAKWQEMTQWTRRHDLNLLIDEVRELGGASHVECPSESLSKAMHDLRGGALSALLGRLQLLPYLPRDEHNLKTIFVLTRDHLKIMRNAVVGLDEPRRDADRRPKAHDVKLMLEKWHDSVVGPKWRERPVRMFMDCRYAGALTECCLESAAIDRIFYNLAANASRYAVGERLDMTVFPLPDEPGECLRFVLSNEVNEEDAAFLRTLASSGADSADRGIGLSLLPLFAPRVSSTGSGFGLTVVADFVAGAFGLKDRTEALRERYLGAVLNGSTFQVWFHWPAARNDLPKKTDDFHHPEKSLSEP